MVKTRCSQYRGHRFDLWYWNSVPEISVQESLVRSHMLCGVASKQIKTPRRFSCGSVVKNPHVNARDMGSILDLGDDMAWSN